MDLEEEICINNLSVINKLSSDLNYDILDNNKDLSTENNSKEIIIEIKSCIICLESLDDKSVNICKKCNVKCHKECLNEWYKKHKKKVCPICLKSNKFYKNRIMNSENNEERHNELNNELNNSPNNSSDSDNSPTINYRNLHMYTPVEFNQYCLNTFCSSRCYIYFFVFIIMFMYTYENYN